MIKYYYQLNRLVTTKGNTVTTYTVMICDGGGSDVYLSGISLEHAETLVATNKLQNEENYTGSVLYIRELKK